MMEVAVTAGAITHAKLQPILTTNKPDHRSLKKKGNVSVKTNTEINFSLVCSQKF